MAERERFASGVGFVLATIGSAVGLGSIWKFPYEVGENGGGGFLLFYLLGLLLVVFPLLLAEFVIGRRGRGGAALSLQRVAIEARRSPHWRWIGLAGIATGFVILTYYAVIAGMTMAYVPHALTAGFAGSDQAASAAAFAELTGSPLHLGFWQAAFLAVAALVVARGVRKGVEAACTFLMPLLAVLMLALVVYAAIEGDLARTLDFLLVPHWQAVSPRAALDALGLGFFSIGVGMGVMITYAAYAGESFDLTRAAITTLAGDTLISLMAGIAIFPIVFAEGLDPAGGANLMFLTLPIAFGALPFGDVVGAAFFLLLFVAGLASTISLFEVVTAPLIRATGFGRARVTIAVAVAAWIGGLPSMLSFNLWAEARPLAGLGFDLGIFDAVDSLASNVLLPACGLALAVFAGWFLPESLYAAELGRGARRLLAALRLLLRWVAPAIILGYVLATQLGKL
ncbi:MAG: sodium-dependent transporter [Rhodospirillaceae bacterium]|nr:sodium-dependent transporter [Rhodospirillaceae bacterium]